MLSRSLDDTLRFHDANNLNLKYDSILKFDLNLKYPSETAIPEFEKGRFHKTRNASLCSNYKACCLMYRGDVVPKDGET